jgi:hypothetical protein
VVFRGQRAQDTRYDSEIMAGQVLLNPSDIIDVAETDRKEKMATLERLQRELNL